VARTCNPNYSGGRDLENQGSKPAWANSSQDPISKNPSPKKKAGGVAQGVGPEFKLQYRKTNHNKNNNILFITIVLLGLKSIFINITVFTSICPSGKRK
jgi:hypothetical protein